ncbi:MAG: MotA/TolQ/ExbB proton channel family protein [Nitrospinota bacterium]|nr:MotA/TolQ/ExbB proton channel family protein [Nitrospinota bacterium]
MGTFAELLWSGGILMIPLFVCSILSLAIIIERIIVLREKQIVKLDVIRSVRGLVVQKKISEAIILCEKNSSSIGRIIIEVLKSNFKGRGVLKETAENAGRQEVPVLEKNLQTLGTIAAVTPLLGLTGTVFGMIKVFTVISEKGIAHPSQLASGISEALVTTATGLVVGIPALVFFNYFSGRIDKYLLKIENHVTQLIEVIVEE